MPTIITNTPFCLIPKELLIEEKIQEYWHTLYPTPENINIGKDEMENFFLLYPKPNDMEAIHEISFLYNSLQEKKSNNECMIGMSLYENRFFVLALKNLNIAYSGYFYYTEKEDILYHLTNISHHFFDRAAPVIFYYQHLPVACLRFLNQYFEINKI